MMETKSLLARALCALFAAYLAVKYYDVYQSAGGPAFKIVERRGRGKCVVAARNIDQGELIIKEPPLLLVHVAISKEQIRTAVSALNSTSRSTFLELSYPPTNDDSKIPDAIFRTNSIKTGDDKAGIFPLTSRINHGCSKAINSAHSWRKDGFLVVHALKPIKKGEELLIEYINTKQSRVKRRDELFEKYEFRCSCSVCSLPPADSRRSDKRIASMNLIMDNLVTWEVKKLNGIEAVRIAKRIWAIGEKEGYWVGRGKLAEYVVRIAAAHDDENAAREWAELAEEWYSYELGEDSEEVKRMSALSLKPSTHPAWGTREPLRVGGTDMDLL